MRRKKYKKRNYSARLYPQGVRRIRKAAKPPTAAQPRLLQGLAMTRLSFFDSLRYIPLLSFMKAIHSDRRFVHEASTVCRREKITRVCPLEKEAVFFYINCSKSRTALSVLIMTKMSHGSHRSVTERRYTEGRTIDKGEKHHGIITHRASD